MGMTMFYVWSGLATANTYTTCCCEQVRDAAAVQYGVHELTIADLYRWSWGRWRVSEARCIAKAMLPKYFEGRSCKLIGY